MTKLPKASRAVKEKVAGEPAVKAVGRGEVEEEAGDEGAGNTCSPPREAKQHTWLQSGSAHGGGSFTQFQLYLKAVQLN